jgi:hypothetical protein
MKRRLVHCAFESERATSASAADPAATRQPISSIFSGIVVMLWLRTRIAVYSTSRASCGTHFCLWLAGWLLPNLDGDILGLNRACFSVDSGLRIGCRSTWVQNTADALKQTNSE